MLRKKAYCPAPAIMRQQRTPSTHARCPVDDGDGGVLNSIKLCSTLENLESLRGLISMLV